MTKGKRKKARAAGIIRVERTVVPDYSTRPLEIHGPVMVERALLSRGRGRGVTSDRVVGPVSDPQRTSIPSYGLPLEKPSETKPLDKSVWQDSSVTPDKRKLRYYQALREK